MRSNRIRYHMALGYVHFLIEQVSESFRRSIKTAVILERDHDLLRLPNFEIRVCTWTRKVMSRMEDEFSSKLAGYVGEVR